MYVRRTQFAPEGEVWARFAFDNALGKTHSIKKDNKVVGGATLIAALPHDVYRAIELVWRVESFFPDTIDPGTDWSPGGYVEWDLDDYIPEFAFNPSGALKRLAAALQTNVTVTSEGKDSL